MNQKVGLGLLIGFIAVMITLCYYLPPSNEFKDPEPPVYYETTMIALDVDGPDVVSVTETEDYDVLRNADAIVLYYTSPEFDDFEETVEFINERMRAGQAVVSMIGHSVFNTDDMSSVVPVDGYVYGIAYSPELNAPFMCSFGLSDWDYDKALSKIAEWLYDMNYPNMEAPVPSWWYCQDDTFGLEIGPYEGPSTTV